MFESHHQLQIKVLRFTRDFCFLRINPIRNLPLRAILHQVARSSHVTGSNPPQRWGIFYLRINPIRNLPLRAILHQVARSSHVTGSNPPQRWGIFYLRINPIYNLISVGSCFSAGIIFSTRSDVLTLRLEVFMQG